MSQKLFKTLTICFLAFVTNLALCDDGRADTIAYYRFENDLVTDASGNGNTLTVINAPALVALPASGPGSDFPNPLPQTGAANTSSVEIANSQSLERIFNAPVVSGSFTVEAFVHAYSFTATYSSNIAVNVNASAGVTKGFMFTVRNIGDFGTSPNELILFLWDSNGSIHAVGSGFIMSPDKDYYVAASFDHLTKTVSYFRQNLTDGSPLETATVTLGGTWDFGGTEAVHIGSGFPPLNDGLRWDGLIDEVRLSDAVLPESQLLITNTNSPPVADAGRDQSIRAGDEVYLDGTASFDDNTVSEDLMYGWVVTAPDGSNVPVTFQSHNASLASFDATQVGTYSATLYVQDEEGLQSTDDALISTDNLAPTSVATSEYTLAIVGQAFMLDGTGSNDPEGDPLDYFWTMSVPAGSTAVLDNYTSPSPSFTPDVDGIYHITLEVRDFIGPGNEAVLDIVGSSPEEFAEVVIVDTADVMDQLEPAQITTEGNAQAFNNFLASAIDSCQKGNDSQAIATLERAIERVDGCALRGAPDANGQGRDWVTDCEEQLAIYTALTAALEALIQ